MRKKIDYNIKDKDFNIFLKFSFPLCLSNIKVEIETRISSNYLFYGYGYTIITKDWIVEKIEYHPKYETRIEQIIKEIVNILKDNLYLIKNNIIELDKKNNDYEYRIILEKPDVIEDEFNYILKIQVFENENLIFNMVLLLCDNENMDNFNNILKTLKSVLKLKNLNIIKKITEKLIKDIVIEEIDNLIKYQKRIK